MNYYDVITHVSNSDLNAIRNALNATEPVANLQQIYNFGNLVDASALEKERLQGNTLLIESGGTVDFQDHDIEKARAMAEAYHSFEPLKVIFQDAKKQHAIYRNAFEITHDGYTFTMAAKCKLDLYRPRIIGGDLKSTACETQQAFIDAIFHFNYDQQAAWYMDLARLDRFMIIGLGKKSRRGKHEVFRYAIERGDNTYLGGKTKYSRLAFKYHFLIANIQL